METTIKFIRHKTQIIFFFQLDAFFKKYEPVHKKLLNNHSALIAVPNYSRYNKILFFWIESYINSLEMGKISLKCC